jgi:hypothetical protein
VDDVIEPTRSVVELLGRSVEGAAASLSEVLSEVLRHFAASGEGASQAWHLVESLPGFHPDMIAFQLAPSGPLALVVQTKTADPMAERHPVGPDTDTRTVADEADIARVADFVTQLAEEASVPSGEALEVLHFVVRGALAERRRTVGARQELVASLTPSLAELDPVPHAAVEQARRLAALRSELLASGAFTYESLADGRGATPAAVRQFVSRARARNELFTVSHDGETLVPSFLLDAELSPRLRLRPIIETLRAAGEDGWALWAWFLTPSGWLGGQRPLDLVDDNPTMVAEAAQRRVSNAA